MGPSVSYHQIVIQQTLTLGGRCRGDRNGSDYLQHRGDGTLREKEVIPGRICMETFMRFQAGEKSLSPKGLRKASWRR